MRIRSYHPEPSKYVGGYVYSALMPNKKGRRGSGHGASNRKYRVPLGLDYNEFVGALGPSDDDVYPELHVRYGVRNDLYLDWSITLQMRLGGIERLEAGEPSLRRRRWQRVEVDGSVIRHYSYDLHNPTRPATVKVVQELSAGDEHVVDAQYDVQMKGLSQSWAANYGTDPHTEVTFRYASKNRDPEFRNSKDFSWVRNTVIALHSDLANEVYADRAATYFAGRPSTAGVLLPDGVMKFIRTDGPGTVDERTEPAAETVDRSDGPLQARGSVTMGMLISTIYSGGNLVKDVEDFLGG